MGICFSNNQSQSKMATTSAQMRPNPGLSRLDQVQLQKEIEQKKKEDEELQKEIEQKKKEDEDAGVPDPNDHTYYIRNGVRYKRFVLFEETHIRTDTVVS
jgi:hypothetical protein